MLEWARRLANNSFGPRPRLESPREWQRRMALCNLFSKTSRANQKAAENDKSLAGRVNACAMWHRGGGMIFGWGGAQVTLSIFGGAQSTFREFLLEENDLLGEFFKSWGGLKPPQPPRFRRLWCDTQFEVVCLTVTFERRRPFSWPWNELMLWERRTIKRQWHFGLSVLISRRGIGRVTIEMLLFCHSHGHFLHFTCFV